MSLPSSLQLLSALLVLSLAACTSSADKGATDQDSLDTTADSGCGDRDVITIYADNDGDGYGDPASATTACTVGSGYAENADDCDDASSAVYPGAEETCDGLDNDCDGAVDNDAVDVQTWYADADGDGYGDAESTTTACDQPEGYAAQSGDCDESDPAVNPGATEVCDGIDNDCDGLPENDDAVDAQTWYRDVDGDGYGGSSGTHVACGQPSGYSGTTDDCDDNDAAIHPGATEICDGIDNDCDGMDEDTDAVDVKTWYLDDDGDGYGEPGTAMSACEQPSGYADNGDDCDDTNSAINPGATEICDDSGVDDDCDGIALSGDGGTWYTDADGDGHGDPSTGVLSCAPPPGTVLTGDDCDDADFAVYPGAPEVCGDGVVNDCDAAAGSVDAICPLSGTVDLADADAKFVGEAAGDYAAFGVVGAGDVDGDGDDEILIGAYGADASGTDAGAVYLVKGPVSGIVDLSDADAKFTGENAGDGAGLSVSNAGDTDGDGLGDLLIGAYLNGAGGTDAGAAYLILGPVSGTTGLGSADAKLVGETDYDEAGWAVSSAGDVNGDGDSDLLVGAFQQDGGALNGGAAYLLLGPVAGKVDLSDADATYLGENASDEAGFSVWTAGDTDGDGESDILIGAVQESTGGAYAGAAYLVLGSGLGTLDLADADAKLVGEHAGDYAGNWVASPVDEDGDGYNDLLITAYASDDGALDAGAAYLVLGPLTGTLSLSAADATLIGENASDGVGVCAAGAGDVNGDGRGDLFIGAYGVDAGGTDAGAAYLVLAPVTGTVALADADATLIGENAGDEAGFAVAGNADVNGDGYGDMLTGAYTESTGGALAGAAYLTLGPGGG